MREENVFKFYLLCNKLKSLIRTGWKNWNVNKERIESVAEHVYGVQMLALAIKSEYQYDVDIYKVIYMLAIHEIGEAVIGDITLFDMDRSKKEKLEHEAVHVVLQGLLDGQTIEKLFLEFDARQTNEARFAYLCDKLECDLQATIYAMENSVDLSNQVNNPSFLNSKVQELLKDNNSWGEMWLKFGQNMYPYDENFRNISNFALSYLQSHLVRKKSYYDNYKKEALKEVQDELGEIGISLINKK